MNEYKVGYKKPPKEHQFKPKNQTAAHPTGGKRKEDSLDVASWIDKPLTMKRGGKLVRIHPHEAAMTSLGKRALTGEHRAAKEFLKQCEIAGMLTPQQLEKTESVFWVPQGVDPGVARVMLETYGLPPWEKGDYAAVVAELEREEAHIEKLYQKFLEDLDHG